MALIRSTILSAIRGSINGSTFSQNRYGAYARNRTNPVNPNTLAQQQIRAAMTASSQAWSTTLNDTQREDWRLYANATPVPNRLGEMIILSGQAMFNKYQTWARNLGLTPPVAPPVSPGLALMLDADTVVIEDDASASPGITVTYNNGSTNALAQYPLWISGPQAAGTSFFKGPWQFVGLKTGATRGAAYITTPSSILAGQSFFVRIGYRDEAGKIGQWITRGPIVAVNTP